LRILAALLLTIVGAAHMPPGSAQESAYTADSVKAAYLYHFGGYVDWAQAKAPEEPLRIGVVGSEAVAAELRRILPGRTIQKRPVVVRELRRGDDAASLDVLYVGPEEPERGDALIKAAQQGGVLIVTDSDKGLEQGGIINFVLHDSRVRFEISLAAAERAGLKLSSRLLSAAVRVKRSLWHLPWTYALRALAGPG
jgi:hypothetical protein